MALSELAFYPLALPNRLGIHRRHRGGIVGGGGVAIAERFLKEPVGVIAEAELKRLICETAIKIQGSCNSHYTTYQAGLLRGLVWALIAEDPGSIMDTTRLSKSLGIPLAELTPRERERF